MKVDGNRYKARCTYCDWTAEGVVHYLMDKAERHEAMYRGHHTVIEDQPMAQHFL